MDYDKHFALYCERVRQLEVDSANTTPYIFSPSYAFKTSKQRDRFIAKRQESFTDRKMRKAKADQVKEAAQARAQEAALNKNKKEAAKRKRQAQKTRKAEMAAKAGKREEKWEEATEAAVLPENTDWADLEE
jgi:hypothetical protein